MRIELVIDELVLRGFDPRHRLGVADEVEAALATPERRDLHAAIRSWRDRRPSAPLTAPRTIATTPVGVGPAVTTAIGTALALAHPDNPGRRHL